MNFEKYLQQDIGTYSLRQILDNLTDDQIEEAVLGYCKQYNKEQNLKKETTNDINPESSTVSFQQIIEKWDTAIVDLYRNNGMFNFNNVRLRHCSLYFSRSTEEYYVKYNDITFSSYDIYNYR